MTEPHNPAGQEIRLVERSGGGELREFAAYLDAVLSQAASAELHFQPIVDLRAGSVAGYEALARFPKEVGLPPNVWFEKAGLLGKRNKLQQLMTRKALNARRLLPPNCFLTVNAGPDFLLSPEWQELVEEARDLSGMVIEITEEAPVENYDALRRYLSQIRRKGASIAVDDAGSGYASLHHILEIKPDFIKIDRHFVQNCAVDRAKSAMIEMVGAAANRLDAWIIAEGVELMNELEELARLSVPLAQGYLLGRPAPEMAQLGFSLADLIQRRDRGAVDSTLAAHLGTCQTCDNPQAALAALSADANAREVVVVDQCHRAVELVERHPLLGFRRLSVFLRAHVASDAGEVLDRALTRDETQRFDPVVVTGTEGEFLGTVSVDRLMTSVLKGFRQQRANS